jgi:hypothetical protein
MKEWIDNILKGLSRVGAYLLSAIGYIKSILPIAEALITWVRDQIGRYAPQVEDPNDPLTGEMATELIVNESQTKFHGSGALYPKAFVLSVVKFVYMIYKSGKLGIDAYFEQSELAVSKGYIKSEDLAMYRRANPAFQPLD